jgi:hypothetical protein
MLFAAVRESGNGTKPTSRHVGWLVAFGGKADIELDLRCTP